MDYQNRFVWKLLLLNVNTGSHITVQRNDYYLIELYQS